MDIFTAIKKRHSTRKYIHKDLDNHDIAVILEAARLAPSSGNLQPWRFIIVRDKHKKESIAEACQKQYWMNTAPVHIVVVAEVEKVQQFYGIRGERLYASQNCAAAIENILLTATALGISSCWVGYFNEDELGGIIGAPATSRVQAVITLGYEEFEESVEKVPLNNIVFFEGYGNRIEDPALTFGELSDVWQRYISKAKDEAKYHKPRIQENLKKHFHKAHSKIKEQLEKITKKK